MHLSGFFFSLLDPDPHSYCGSESGRKNECGSTRIRIHSPDRYLEFLKVSCNFMMRFFLQNQVRSDQGVLTKIRIGTAPRSPTTLPTLVWNLLKTSRSGYKSFLVPLPLLALPSDRANTPLITILKGLALQRFHLGYSARQVAISMKARRKERVPTSKDKAIGF